MVYLDNKIVVFIILEYVYLELVDRSYQFVMDNIEVELVLGCELIYFVKLEVGY